MCVTRRVETLVFYRHIKIQMDTFNMLLMIDNYDSFTYNIVQYFGELNQEVKVVRNDAVT